MIKAQIERQVKSVALIVGQGDFVGFFLKEALARLHCRAVLVEPEELAGLELERFDYCFYLAPRWEKSLLRSLARLARKFGGKLLVGNAGDWNEEIGEELRGEPRLDCRWVVWEDVYGPRMPWEEKNWVSQLVKKAIEGGTVVVANDGSEKIYPLFVADLIYQLTRLIFAPRTKNKVYRVRGEAKSCLSATLEAQKLVGGQIKIKFVKREKRKKREGGRWEEVEMKKLVGWSEGLRLTQEYFVRQQKSGPVDRMTSEVLKQPEKEEVVELSGKKRRWKGVVLAAVMAVLGGLVFYPAGQCYYRMGQVERALGQGDFALAFRAARVAETNCQKVGIVSERGRAGGELAGLLSKNEKVFNQVRRLGQLIFQEKNLTGKERLKETEELTMSLKPELKNLYEDLSLLDYSGMLPVKVETNLSRVRRLVLGLSQMMEYVSEMTGKDQSKSYLVLLQNSNELRPTGGFIGSVAVVTFNQGQLVDFEVRDVYSLDGQLKGHVEPPAELKKYLGEASWYLRDVNWEADFPVVAMRAGWFLEKETGRRVDGVAAVNLAAAQKLMSVLGEVEVSDFGEKISAQNLFERAEYHSEINFFPGSTQKQDFLGGLARAVFEKARRLEGREVLTLLAGFYQALQEKEILVYVDQPQVQLVLASLNWHGGWQKPQCLETTGQVCLTDYLMLVEANVGVNKANYFVTRETELAVEMAEGELKSKLTLTYGNESPAAVFPGGDYKNYLRLVLPMGVRLEKVLVEGQEVERTKVEESRVKDRWVVGLLVEVPIKQRRRVQIEYSRRFQLAVDDDLKKPQHYVLLVQKQSGVREEIFKLRLIPGAGRVGFQFQPEARVDKGGYLWAVPWKQDVSFEAYLTK